MNSREPQERCPPACSRCATGRWMAFDVMWCAWICQVCGEWQDPYDYPSRARTIGRG